MLIEVEGRWRLARIGAWKLLVGDVRTARHGRNGQVSCNVRMSHYAAWIRAVMEEGSQGGAAGAVRATAGDGAL